MLFLRGRALPWLWIGRLVLALILFAGSAVQSWRDTRDDAREYDAVDLRERIVGTRALSRDRDPYVVHTDDPSLRDPCAAPRAGAPSRATNPPTAYLLSVPFAGGAYADAKVAWYWCQWVALGLLLASLAAWRPRDIPALLAAAAFCVFTTSPWRSHVERGQAYIIVGALLALGSVLHFRYRKPALGGALYGVAMALKLVPFVLLVPLVVARERRAVVGSVAGASTIVVASIGLWGVRPWLAFVDRVLHHRHAVAGIVQHGAQCAIAGHGGVSNATWANLFARFGIHAPLPLVAVFVLAALALTTLLLQRHLRAGHTIDETWWLWMSLYLHLVWPAAPVSFSYQHVLWMLAFPSLAALACRGALKPHVAAVGAILVSALHLPSVVDVRVGLMLILLASAAWSVGAEPPAESVRS